MAAIENIGAYSSWRNVHNNYEKLEGNDVIKMYVHNKYSDILQTRSRIGFHNLEVPSDRLMESSSNYVSSLSHWISTQKYTSVCCSIKYLPKEFYQNETKFFWLILNLGKLMIDRYSINSPLSNIVMIINSLVFSVSQNKVEESYHILDIFVQFLRNMNTIKDEKWGKTKNMYTNVILSENTESLHKLYGLIIPYVLGYKIVNKHKLFEEMIIGFNILLSNRKRYISHFKFISDLLNNSEYNIDSEKKQIFDNKVNMRGVKNILNYCMSSFYPKICKDNIIDIIQQIKKNGEYISIGMIEKYLSSNIILDNQTLHSLSNYKSSKLITQGTNIDKIEREDNKIIVYPDIKCKKSTLIIDKNLYDNMMSYRINLSIQSVNNSDKSSISISSCPKNVIFDTGNYYPRVSTYGCRIYNRRYGNRSTTNKCIDMMKYSEEEKELGYIEIDKFLKDWNMNVMFNDWDKSVVTTISENKSIMITMEDIKKLTIEVTDLNILKVKDGYGEITSIIN